MKYKTIEEAYSHIEDAKKEVEKKINESDHYTEEEIAEFYKNYELAIKNNDNELIKKSDLKVDEYANNKAFLKRLNNIKQGDIMLVKTRYLLAPHGSRLVSPSGFHISERVFMKIDNAIATNRLPKSGNMIYWDLEKIDK